METAVMDKLSEICAGHVRLLDMTPMPVVFRLPTKTGGFYVFD
jgi:hypothetical protein